ncbi:MAG TPA: translocation/assembly module TamB domain-containing protein [Salinarimonas sp.]|nr:translocation/assembly module TamB domain-containing protein [Salinarimonas sp.]
MRRPSRLVATLTAVAALIGLAALLLGPSPGRAQSDQGVLAGLVSRLLSTPATRVSIGAVEGALSSNAVIRDIQVSDREGVWLRVDEARLTWSRAALLRGRLQVDLLEIGRVDLPRRPLPGEETPPADGPLLPELPVRVAVGRFALSELALGAPWLGTAARLSAEGRATLGPPAEGLDLRFLAARRDAPGRLALELAYAPGTERLRLDLVHEEPAGGIAARLLDLPGLPPVDLRLAGEGPLSAFAARLDLTAGPEIGARGEARVSRAGAAYATRLDLAARIAGLLPGSVAPLFAGETRLEGGARIGDDGRIGIERLRLASAVAALEVDGAVAPDRRLDLRVTGRALPAARAGAVKVGTLDVDLAVRGALRAPRLDGTVRAADLHGPAGALGRLDLRLASEPVGDDAVADRFRVALDASATGLALADRALGRALGDRATLVARGAVGTDGVAAFDEARVETPTLAATFAGRVGPRLLDGRLDARVPSLAPLSGLAGSSLSGAARLEADLSGEPARPAARLDASLDRFASGRPALDGLLGARARLTGAVARLADGFALDNLRLAGANLDLRADGRATAAAADVRLRAAVPALARLDPAITAGRGSFEARLTGGLDRPDGNVRLLVEDARALGRPIPRLALTLRGTDLTGALDASGELDGTVAGRPARGRLRVARPAPGAWRLSDLDVTVGSARASGAVSTRDGLLEGALRLAADDLDDLSPLLLTRLAGDLRGSVELAAPDRVQTLRLVAEGSRLRVGDVTLARLEADVLARDPLGQPQVEGRVAAASLVVAGETIRDLRLEARGEGGATRFAITGSARELAVEARGSLRPEGRGNRVDLAAFQARRGAQRIALAAPARLVLEAGRLQVDDLALLVGSGRVTLSGRVGDELDLAIRAAGVPLAAAEIVRPGLGLAGTLDATARLAGPAARPAGEYQASLRGIQAPVLREAGLGPVDLRASGRLADGRASLDATLDLARGGRLSATGSLPLGEGALDIALRGRLDLALANGFLSPAGQRVAGNADLDLSLRGTLADPALAGGVTIGGGRFEDPLRGVRLEGIAGRLQARGDEIAIQTLSARTPNGGSLEASGRVVVDPGRGFPGEIRIAGRRAQLAAGPEATAVADLDLALSGALARRPTVAGRVDLVTLDIAVPERLGGVAAPLPGTRHVAPPPQAAARLAVDARRRGARAGGRPVAPFEAALDLVVAAQNRIFVRGRGLEAELGGSLRLTGTTRAVVAVGAFELRRGRFDILGQRLDLTRGRLDFAGDLVPNLDFVAETRAADVTARIAVTGPAASPDVAISSDPDLPQDEVLSRLLFRRAAGGLSPGQALQLASAVATLSGGGSGGLEDLRRSLGVDSLDITTGAGGGPAVGVSRYISDRIRLGVRAGARPEESGVTVDIDLTRRLRLQGAAGADGRSSVGIGAEWEY